MRKFISIFLALVMCASLVVPAFAASADTTIDNPVCFEYSENGMFKPINDASRMRSSKNIISTTPTENPDVFHVEENNYLVRSYDDNYVMSLRYPIDAEHFDTQNYQDVPPEVLERVAAEIREQQLIGNNEFTVDIYGPAESTTRDGWGGVYPYGPYFLKDWFVDLKYAHTDMVEKKGSKAIDYADMLKEIIIETIKDDMIEEINLPIFEKGITALDHILKVAGIEKLSQLSSNDYIKTDTVFHKMGKSVYVLDGSTWKPSTLTMLVTIVRVNTYSFFSETGETPYTSNDINEEIPSENYNNPAKAIEMIGAALVDRPIIHEVLGERFIIPCSA